MKTITNTYNVYSFEELSESAKAKAIDNLRDINVDHDWWDGTYEDAKNIGLEITSFDLDRNRHVKGHFVGSPKQSADLIIDQHGNECETYKTATKFIEDITVLQTELDRLEEKDATNEQEMTDAEYNLKYDIEDKIEDFEAEFLKSILEDYAIMLDKDYEYLQTDEAIKETIEANEYTFLEDGTMKNS